MVGVLVALVCGGLAGCLAATSDDEAGFGKPTQPSSGADPGPREDVTGVVVVRESGCVDLDLGDQGSRWIVWPDTVGARDSGAGMVLGDQVVTAGDTLGGSGALAEANVLPDFDDPDSYVGAYGRFCAADELGIVVFGDARGATG